MESAFAELPLALFSTLAPIGAGAFLVLAVLFSTAKLDPEQTSRIDKMTAIPVCLVVVGFVAAFFHLANPMHAPGVFAGLGASPMSNELAAGCLFAAVMLVYWIWAMTGKMGEGARKGMAWATAVLGIVFAWFTGMAYMIDTIPSWNTLAGPVQIVGFALVGGGAVAALVVALAKCGDMLKQGATKATLLAVLAAGIVLGVGGIAAQAAATGGMGNALASGADLVSAATMVIVCGAICLVGTGVVDALVVRGKGAGALVGASCGAVVLAVVGTLLLRLAFYSMQLSAGLSIM